MNYAIAAFALALLYYALHAENKHLSVQIAELRRVTDYQLAGLRADFAEVKNTLKWIEPQLRLNTIPMYVAARDTQ
jgi:hypothetical protein